LDKIKILERDLSTRPHPVKGKLFMIGVCKQEKKRMALLNQKKKKDQVTRAHGIN
jgi:hypothetical protein